METPRKPDFLIIGAQKAGTTWLWAMLRQHPGVQFPETKEIHFFGGSEPYAQGLDNYLAHFDGISPEKRTGEASTAMFFDRVPYWYNEGRNLAFDDSLPLIPELVRRDLGDVKIIVLLRDPVRRAVSAYRHWMRKGELSPLAGLRKTATSHPKLRILEYGDYATHLAAWLHVFPRESILCLVYEDDVVADPAGGLSRTFSFLGLDPDFRVAAPDRRVHGSWTWTRSVVRHLAGPLGPALVRGRFGAFLDRRDFLRSLSLKDSDVEFLRERYLPQQAAVEALSGRDLRRWDYGEKLLDR